MKNKGFKSHINLFNRIFEGHFRVQHNRTITLFFGALALLLCHTGLARGNSEMSDEKKKEVVYRLYSGYKKDFPAVEDISPQQAMELWKQEKVVFVDTRKSAEMAVSMLPAAVSESDFLNHPDQYKGKTIVAYCTISYRSGVFAREMAKQGITITNLQAGILAWTLEGGKVYNESGQEVRRIHVYGDKWDYVPDGYESVKFGMWDKILNR